MFEGKYVQFFVLHSWVSFKPFTFLYTEAYKALLSFSVLVVILLLKEVAFDLRVLELLQISIYS